MQMTYSEVITQIENKKRFGNLAGVEIAGRMLKVLGNPQSGMRVIHIAGTNGKGSVSAFLCEILRAAGFRTGMFTSPHLVDFRERIRVDGEMIGESAAHRLGEALLSQEFGVHPTMFDYCLAMALLYFKEQKCDVIILETGLGGRLDSTNAVGVPDVSVITRIGYDHTAILGESLAEIAAEKAGILKRGTALVVERQEASARSVILAAAKEAGVGAIAAVDEREIWNCGLEDGEQIFSFGEYEALRMRMLGVHQYENAAAAILAAEAFVEKAGIFVPRVTQGGKGSAFAPKLLECSVRRGIYAARWPGRMEVLSKCPFLMVDGAHNSSGVEALGESLMALFPGEKFHFIMGVMADKDYEEMIEVILPLALDFQAVTVESSRALKARELAACVARRGVPAVCAENVAACIAPGRLDMQAKTVAFGSLYFVGEIERLFL